MNEPGLLQVKNLSVSIGPAKILHDISLQISPGEVVSLIGPNGAGKTTLLRTISGIYSPKEGEINFKGQVISGQNSSKIAKMGLTHVPQGRGLFSDLSVADNLRLGELAKGGRQSLDVAAYIGPSYAIIEKHLSRQAGMLSGGEQQLVSIARGLMASPDLIMLDEPSLGLAPIVVNQVCQIIERLRERGVAVLWVEQLAKQAISIADRIYMLEGGRFVASGTKEEILEMDALKKTYLGT